MNKLIIGLLLMVLTSPSFSQDKVLKDIIESTLALDTNFLVDEANGDTISFETRPYGSDTLLEITRRNSAEYFSATIALNDGLLRTFSTTEKELTFFSYYLFSEGDKDYEIISGGGNNFATRNATRKEIIAGKKQMRNELKNIAKAMK